MHTLSNDITKTGTCSILLTTKCNLKCPWCIQTRAKSNNKISSMPNTWSSDLLNELFTHMQECGYRKYSILGGEPLLYVEKMFQIYEYVYKTLGSDKHLKLFTNATLLTPDIVDKLNDLNVEVFVALGYRGYKGLDTLLNVSKRMDIIDNIRSIRRKTIKYVFTRKERFALDAILLYSIFGCRVAVCPDYTELNNWDDSDIDHIQNELTYLKENFPGNENYISYDITNTNRCNCIHKPNPIYPDGVRRYPGFYSKNCIYGCAACLDSLGYRLYNRYITVLHNHMPNKPRHNTIERCVLC